MSPRLQPEHPIYPLIGLAAAVVIVVVGLLTAKSNTGLYFLAAVWLAFFCFGYRKAALAVLPFAFVFCLILAGITYAISKDVNAMLAAINRILAICVAIIPGLGMSPGDMVRSFSALKLPRMLTLGMMITLTFFPLLAAEVRRIREAMKTRGAGSMLQPGVFYRAFLIPLMMRLISISDTLALSVETRGFSAAGAHTEYKTVHIQKRDILFAVILLLLVVLAVLL